MAAGSAWNGRSKASDFTAELAAAIFYSAHREEDCYEKLEERAAWMHIERLRNEALRLKGTIEAIEASQRSGGKEPEDGTLHQQLAEEQLELEKCLADYELKYGKPKPRWQFWK